MGGTVGYGRAQCFEILRNWGVFPLFEGDDNLTQDTFK